MISAEAILANIARDMVVSKNTLAHCKSGYSLGEVLDGPAYLMTEDSSWPIATVSLFDVCSAYPGSRQSDENFSWSKGWDWDVLDSNLAFVVDQAGLHGCMSVRSHNLMGCWVLGPV